MNRRLTPIAVLAVSLHCASVLAAVYHLAQRSPQASDAAPGTAERPWRSISTAAGSSFADTDHKILYVRLAGDRERVSYQVHDLTVRHNVCTLNRRYQIGLWCDNPFFGPHPMPSVGSKGTALDPAEANLRFDDNCYWMEETQQLVLWGCPWRKGHLTYSSLAAWQTARGQDARSLVVDPQLVAPSKGDWSLRPESPARKLGTRRSEEITPR